MMGCVNWHYTLLFEPWIVIEQNVIDDLNALTCELKHVRKSALFNYVDKTVDDEARAFYVGKGNKDRIRKIERNDRHAEIRAERGLVRHVVKLTFDDEHALKREVELIRQLDTYRYGGSRYGANLTLGGDGARGSKRPRAACRAACKAIRQLTLGGELITMFSSIKEAKEAVPGSSPVLCCKGILRQSKGFRWEYVDSSSAVTRSRSCRDSMSAAAHKRPIVQSTLDGVVVATFPSARIASEATGVGEDNVRRVCYNAVGTAGGFVWHYVDDDRPHDMGDNIARAVVQMMPDGQIVAEYGSMIAASRATGIFHTNISGVCCGTRRVAGGYLWKYT